VGDRGKLGSVRARWVGPIDDAEEFAFGRAIVAAAGPFVGDSWEHEGSRGDRAKVEEVRWPAWSRDAWEFMVLDKTRRLRRTDPFRTLHYRVVKALERLGDFGTLAGDELRHVLDLPDATSFLGASRSEVATSAGVSGDHDADKVADAAAGVGTSSRGRPSYRRCSRDRPRGPGRLASSTTSSPHPSSNDGGRHGFGPSWG
jgi:hypothetical protein